MSANTNTKGPTYRSQPIQIQIKIQIQKEELNLVGLHVEGVWVSHWVADQPEMSVFEDKTEIKRFRF